MQLAEHAGEGGLATLVRTGDNDDAFLAVEVEVVADDLAVADYLVGEGKVEGIGRATSLLCPTPSGSRTTGRPG